MLNILAFIFIGLQIGPIMDGLEPADRGRYFSVAGAVLLTVIVVRIAWHMSFNAVIRWRDRRFGFHPPRPMLRPTVGSGLVISWSGMRGIVTLAAALALPSGFPFRDLIVLTAFSVVLGTLVDPGNDAEAAVARARSAGRRSGWPGSWRGPRTRVAGRARDLRRRRFTGGRGPPAGVQAHLARRSRIADAGEAQRPRTPISTAPRSQAARQAVLAMRARTRSATTPSTRSKSSWTGSRWPAAGSPASHHRANDAAVHAQRRAVRRRRAARCTRRRSSRPPPRAFRTA